jgi:ankyrin repeat protein
VRLLLESGADVNARTTAGATPLDTAARKGKPAIVHYLKSRGGLSGNDERLS